MVPTIESSPDAGQTVYFVTIPAVTDTRRARKIDGERDSKDANSGWTSWSFFVKLSIHPSRHPFFVNLSIHPSRHPSMDGII
jgi:hypothetical protein